MTTIKRVLIFVKSYAYSFALFSVRDTSVGLWIKVLMCDSLLKLLVSILSYRLYCVIFAIHCHVYARLFVLM
ncbi:hypothetical protein QVD17_30039 [Tagetes erecta]|uniref:Uncharacterized protein n=1 Tax=Tagetes erecta TaxID=13708 RepID=A0AAD8K770_TARER|nr:hypothetical protein QVD17_30039 [Tagetes erecta]